MEKPDGTVTILFSFEKPGYDPVIKLLETVG